MTRGGTRPGAGRPRLPGARSTALYVRVTPAEHQQIAELAARAGLSASEYLRRVALAGLPESHEG